MDKIESYKNLIILGEGSKSRGKKDTKNNRKEQVTATNINLMTSVTILNVDGLDTPTKGRLSE